MRYCSSLAELSRGEMLDATEVNRYKTRNSPGDEIENVNFPYDDIVHALQNTIDSCINSATDRRGYVLEHMFTTFLCLTSPTEGFAWDDLRKILTGCQRVAKVYQTAKKYCRKFQSPE